MPSFSDLLQGFKDDMRSGDAFRMLTGMQPQDIRQAGQNAAISEDPFLTNAPSHSAATEAMSRRVGPNIAQIIGMAQEVPSGLGNRAEGKSFFTTEGESGFSHPDLVANASGALRTETVPSPLTAAVIASGMLQPQGSPSRGLAERAIQSKADQLSEILSSLRDTGGGIVDLLRGR